MGKGMEYGLYLGILALCGVLAWIYGTRCHHYFGPPRKSDNDRLVQTCTRCGKRRQVIE